MADIRIQIADALKKSGPAKPFQIADAIGVDPGKVKTALKAMLDAKELQAAGATVARLYALPGQKIGADDAPPQPRGKKTAGKKRRTKKAKRTQRARPTAPAADDAARGFIAAITARREIVLFDGTPEPRVYTKDQSREIADLCLDNYDPT